MRAGSSAAVLGVLFALTAGHARTQASQPPQDVQLIEAQGRALTASHCAICHSLEYIPSNAPAMDRAGWEKSVQKMKDRFGAPMTDEDARAILDYLAGEYSGKS